MRAVAETPWLKEFNDPGDIDIIDRHCWRSNSRNHIIRIHHGDAEGAESDWTRILADSRTRLVTGGEGVPAF